MSDYESHRGKIILVEENVTKERMLEFAFSIVSEEIPEYYDDIFEYLRSEQDEYFFSDRNIYRVSNKKLNPDSDEFYWKALENKKELEYSLRFYNGGTCLAENIEDIISEFEKGEN